MVGGVPLTKELLDDYVANHLVPAIMEAVRSMGDVVVAQALYRREHRLYVEERLASAGISVRWVFCHVPFWQNFKQLWSRTDGFRWVLYWLMSKPFFQPA